MILLVEALEPSIQFIQVAEHLAEPFVDRFEPSIHRAEARLRVPVQCRSLSVDIVESSRDLAELPVDAIHALVHLAEPLMHLGELLVHLGELLVNLSKLLVHPGELLVHLGELLVHLGELTVMSLRPSAADDPPCGAGGGRLLS